MEGIIFNIKRFAVHDGPGIRTSIFLKGCPLNCVWCHNPEGISQEISIWYNKNLCISCGQCVDVCPNNALTSNKDENNFIKIDRELCCITGNCVKICPTTAIQYTGWKASINDLIIEIEKDMLFYLTSGGGVTLTGGEPLYQPDFCEAILNSCKARKIHTAIETCLFCERDTLDRVLNYVDLFMIDMKLCDPLQHEYYTGKTNEIIKDNLYYLEKMKKSILIRVPLIKNITDNETNIKNIEKFMYQLNPEIPIEYLNYNPLTENKYQKLGIRFDIKKWERSDLMG